VDVTAKKGLVEMKPGRTLRTCEMLSAADKRKERHAMQQVKAGRTRPWMQGKHDLGL
jgi:hypothetical protein